MVLFNDKTIENEIYEIIFINKEDINKQITENYQKVDLKISPSEPQKLREFWGRSGIILGRIWFIRNLKSLTVGALKSFHGHILTVLAKTVTKGQNKDNIEKLSLSFDLTLWSKRT